MLPFLRQLAHQVWLKGRRFGHNAPVCSSLWPGSKLSAVSSSQAGIVRA
jgi:hypothetical protein